MTAAPTGSQPSACLLLVEDEASLRRAFALAFTKAGYEVLEACDVAEAIRHWEGAGDRVALILSDVQMPGPPVETLMLAARAGTRHVPIVLMSGAIRGTEERINQLIGAADAFIAKPVRLDALRLEVERQLRAPTLH